MANFIKDSIAELEHVVWPTHIETKNFFQITLSIIVGMTIFTYLLTLLFGNGLFELKAYIHSAPAADISASPVVSGEVATQPSMDIQTEGGGTVTVTPEVTQ